jgi:hypothetical protein
MLSPEMKKLTVMFFLLPLFAVGQDTCSSPYGPAGYMSSFPYSHGQLEDSNFCEYFTPPQNTWTRCYTLVPRTDSIYINIAFQVEQCNFISVDDATFFNLACDTLGSGNFLGQLTRDTIVWCVSGNSWGGVDCNDWGFLDICPYYVDLGTAQFLPVMASPVRAFEVRDDVLIQWTAFVEINNAGFRVERSTGEEFETIGYLPGRGTSYSHKQYTFTDHKPYPGLNYYRVYQEDLDGREAVVGQAWVKINQQHTYTAFDILGRVALITMRESDLAQLPRNRVYVVLRDGLPYRKIAN